MSNIKKFYMAEHDMNKFEIADSKPRATNIEELNQRTIQLIAGMPIKVDNTLDSVFGINGPTDEQLLEEIYRDAGFNR